MSPPNYSQRAVFASSLSVFFLFYMLSIVSARSSQSENSWPFVGLTSFVDVSPSSEFRRRRITSTAVCAVTTLHGLCLGSVTSRIQWQEVSGPGTSTPGHMPTRSSHGHSDLQCFCFFYSMNRTSHECTKQWRIQNLQTEGQGRGAEHHWVPQARRKACMGWSWAAACGAYRGGGIS